jgi:hypothetical protein
MIEVIAAACVLTIVLLVVSYMDDKNRDIF